MDKMAEIWRFIENSEKIRIPEEYPEKNQLIFKK